VTLTLTFRSISILESQFSKHCGVGQGNLVEAKAIADCHIPKLMKFQHVTFWRWKNLESQFDYKKPSNKSL
jgi:hypothetical protein